MKKPKKPRVEEEMEETKRELEKIELLLNDGKFFYEIE